MVPLNPAALDTLVLDANVLLPLLAWTYVKEGQTSASLAPMNKPLRDSSPGSYTMTHEDCRQWLALFQHAQRRLTTSYVVAELYGLSTRVLRKESGAALFWQHSASFLKAHVEDRPCPLATLLSQPHVAELQARLGPADTSLILLATERKLDWNQTRGVLVTEDMELYREALRQPFSIRAELLHKLLLAG